MVVNVRFPVVGGSRRPNPAQPDETGFEVSEEERPLRSSKLPRCAVLALALISSWTFVSFAAADEADSLKRAIALFDEGDYAGAQEMLTTVDRSKLSAEQQTLRDDYLARSQVAITMSEKAVRDLEDAETAVKEKELDRAKQLLDAVLGNKYAAAKLKQSAEEMKRSLGGGATPVRPADAKVQEGAPSRAGSEAETPKAQESAPAVAKPTNGNTKANNGEAKKPNGNGEGGSRTNGDVEKARALTEKAGEWVRGAKFDEAKAAYEEALVAMPGYPEAVAGLKSIAEHQENVGARGDSLIERIHQQNQINWQRAVAEYRDVEQNIRAQVTAERFEEAQNLLVRAKQVVEAGKQFADPIAKYEALRDENDALTREVADAERVYNSQKVSEIQRQIETERDKRIQQDTENRRRQVESLMAQAMQHRKDGDLDAAVTVLKQVTVIDPKDPTPRWMLDELENDRELRRGRKLREQYYEQSQKAFNDVEEAKIPWHQELLYPDNWPELIARDERQRPGAKPAERRLYSALERHVPVDFVDEPFDRVIERFAEGQKLNIIVNWNDLRRAGVARNTPIELRLPEEISLQKALTEVLEQAGGGTVDLGFDVSDGAIKVATRATLDKETYTAVYDIQDLLMEIPQFTEGPSSDLRQSAALSAAKLAAAERDARPWAHGDDDDDDKADRDPEDSARVQRLIGLIEETVAPSSWTDRGGTVGTIKEINGQLVITQNAAAQRQVGNLLGKLREQRAVQIAVEARFITVSSHYLEELGIDIDIALNSGNAGYDYIPGAAGPTRDPVSGSALLLPRQFSRLGLTPGTPALGTATTRNPAAVPQPYGQPFLVPQRSGGVNSGSTPVPVINQVTSFTDPANIGSDIPGSFAGQNIGPAFSLFGSFLDNIQVDFLIRATQADSRTSVLTAPRLVLFNGQRSWVAVTVQQAFVRQLNPVVAAGAVAQAPQTDVVDSGAVLDVSATVTADKRYVTMTVRPGVTRLLDLVTIPFSGGGAGGGFGGGTAGQAFIQLPTLSSQRVQTTVSVPDGGTLLIGGQKLAAETEVEAGVPILSKIPILKRAYTSRTQVKDEQTLLILIKPKIFIQSEQEELAFPAFNKG